MNNVQLWRFNYHMAVYICISFQALPTPYTTAYTVPILLMLVLNFISSVIASEKSVR